MICAILEEDQPETLLPCYFHISAVAAWAQSFYREGQILIPKEIYSTLDPLMPCIRLPREENDEQTRKYSFIFISVFNSCPAEEIYLLYPLLVPWGVESKF